MVIKLKRFLLVYTILVIKPKRLGAFSLNRRFEQTSLVLRALLTPIFNLADTTILYTMFLAYKPSMSLIRSTTIMLL